MATHTVPDESVRHGTYDGYQNHKCRCRPCRNAFADWYREAAARRAALQPCSIEGCDGGVYAKGLCKAHDQRQRRGMPLDEPIVRRPNQQGRQPGKRKPD